MEYYYSRMESLWCGYWNHLICRKWKCEVDYPFKSTVIKLDIIISDALCGILDLEFKTIHLLQIIFKFWFVYGQYIIDAPVREIEHKRCSFPVESKDCINSALYECRKMSARWGAQFCTHWLLEDFSGKNQNHENIVNLTPKHFDDVIFRVLICRISTDFWVSNIPRYFCFYLLRVLLYEICYFVP